MNRRSICLLPLIAVSGVSLMNARAVGQSRGAIPPPRPAAADMLVGAYYFPGWCQEDRWYCVKAHPDVLHPLLGYYREGDPQAADWHIKWAVEHGVSFFAFDFYTEHGSEMLEAALADGFLRAQFIDRFRFCLNWCNHAPAETQDLAELEAFEDLVIDKYLTHPSYLRIDGKPVVMILAGYSFVQTLGVERAREAFAQFDERCRAAGLPGVYLVFCEGGINSQQAVEESFAAGAQAFCLYNYPYAGTEFTGPGRRGEATYEHLIAEGEKLWKHWQGITGKRFWPTAMPGWDRRPWTKDLDLVRTGSTPGLFGQSLRAAREHVNDERVVMIEAWNEWGEGSVLEPSEEWQFAYLQEVHGAFCPDAPLPEPADPKALGMPRPAFDFGLPSRAAWTFDFDCQGWTGARCEDLRSVGGALTTLTTTGDPALSGPASYVACENFRSLRVRMKLTPPEGNERSQCVCQVFWSTVERQMGEATSVTFAGALDGKWHVYEVDLAANLEWRGLADRLRLDPADVPGVRVEVDRIELV